MEGENRLQKNTRTKARSARPFAPRLPPIPQSAPPRAGPSHQMCQKSITFPLLLRLKRVYRRQSVFPSRFVVAFALLQARLLGGRRLLRRLRGRCGSVIGLFGRVGGRLL